MIDRHPFLGIIIVIILLFFCNSCSIYWSRQQSHMVKIDDTYAYNWDTGTVYIETYISDGNVTYTEYISNNGNHFKYVNGQIVEIIGDDKDETRYIQE